jgi:mediator of RNA polymerase II transcription subunit 13
MKRAYRTGVPILFHLVPEVQVLQCGVSGINDTRRSILTITACDVYDRLPVMAQRRPPRTTTGSIPQLLLSAPRFLAPAYSLARREHITYKFTPNSTWIDAIDRCMLLHVGYAITSDGRWTIATCVDELGEASDISVWLTQPDNGYAHLVARVWSFVHEFAQKANIEWRIIIQKWGSMEEDELDGMFS